MCPVSSTDKKSTCKTVGGKTMAGLIGMFTESLHMSKDEVLHTPYRLLIMMQHDKVRVEYGDKKEDTVTKMSGRALMNKRKGR